MAGGTAHAAPPDTHTAATWNMQNGRDRWAGAYALARTTSVVTLQEVPNVEPSAAVLLMMRGQVAVYHWRESTRDPVRYLHILPQASQNLAIITTWWPDTVHVVDGNYRDALAVGNRTDNVMFAAIHASANGGSDSASLVRRVSDAATANTYAHWAVLGDFNRDPGLLPVLGLPQNSRIYNPGQATQRSGGQLDYMVSNVLTDNWQATVGANAGSDHWPVRFGSLRAAAEPPELTIHADNSDRLLDVYQAEDRNGTHVITYHDTGGANQKWRLSHIGTADSGQPLYRLISSDTGKCLDVNQGQSSTAGNHLNIWTCHRADGQPDPGGPQRDTQNYTLEHPVAHMPNLTMLRNNATGLYANVNRNETDDGAWLIQWPDQAGGNPVPNETFYLHPPIAIQ
ncbi:MAG TPA: RICIN domain-containing protein [Actinophytocola sp.]|uniref:RICIN domain-containing protein n=1 Tax=Actinophytocola sp. TaxID=1872138 RepID=UPI002DC00599|nr:RICIN domain-containing protein [Actinophytocola sp.]HEU5473775.1 RICIN domain-containing protein [Actinophytocola sp.]